MRFQVMCVSFEGNWVEYAKPGEFKARGVRPCRPMSVDGGFYTPIVWTC